MDTFKQRFDLPDDLQPGEHVIQVRDVEEDGTVVYELATGISQQRREIPFREFEAHGTTWEVTVDVSGDFIARLKGSPGTMVRADRYHDLDGKAKAIARQRRAKIRVPFCEVSPGGAVRNGIIYGIHMGTGKPLVEWEDGTKGGQLPEHRWGEAQYYPPMSAEHAQELARLGKAWQDAEKEFRSARNARRPGGWDLSTEIARAIDKVTKGGD